MTTTPEADGRLRRISVAVALGIFAVNLDFFAIQTALPVAARDLGTTTAELQWAVSGYLLSTACFLIIGGRLADIFGRRTFLMLGMSVFGLTSLIGGMAATAELLIIMRVLQGVGAAVIFPVGLSIITNSYPKERAQRAVGTAIGAASIGIAFGPLFSGLLIQFLSWRWVLWVNVPVALAVIVLVARDVTQSIDPDADRRIDWWGLILVAASVGAFTYGIDSSGSDGWTSPTTLGFIAAGLIGLLVLIVVELRVRSPLLDLQLFRIREFTVTVLAGMADNMAALAVIFASMTYLQGVLGQSALVAATAFLAFSVPYALGNELSGGLAKFRSWAVMALALLLGGVGTFLMGLFDSMPLFLLAAAMSGLGLGVAWAFTSVVTQAVVPPRQAGLASGVVLTILIGMGGVAVALASSVIEANSATVATTSTAIDAVLMGFGVLTVLGAALVTFLGRRGVQPAAP
jgi:EmrB/QacA subfamily drug resistance transporter